MTTTPALLLQGNAFWPSSALPKTLVDPTSDIFFSSSTLILINNLSLTQPYVPYVFGDQRHAADGLLCQKVLP